MKPLIIPQKPKRPGFVYLLQAEGGYYKIGKSKLPSSRVKAFKSLPFKVQLAHQIKTDDAPWLEARLHSQFESTRVIGEWFTLTAEEVAGIKGMVKYNRPPCFLRVLVRAPRRLDRKRRTKRQRGRLEIVAESAWIESVIQAARHAGATVSDFVRSAVNAKLRTHGFQPTATMARGRGRPSIGD